MSRIRTGKLSAHSFYFFVPTGHHFVGSLLPQSRVLLFSEKEGLKRQLFEEKIIHILHKLWIKRTLQNDGVDNCMFKMTPGYEKNQETIKIN